MRIGINALFIRPGKMGGGEFYFRNLVKALIQTDRQNGYIIYLNRKHLDSFDFTSENVKVIGCPILGASKMYRVFWEQLIFPRYLKKHKIDIVHSFSQTGLLFAPCRSIMTILDLQHHYYPANFSFVQLLYLKVMIWITSKRSDKIITISNNSRNDILNILKVTVDKVDVVYASSGFDNSPCFADESDKSRVRNKYMLNGEYILSVASLLPHKNLPRLIRAYSLLPSNNENFLVLVGMQMKSLNQVEKTIRSVGLSNTRVKLLGYVPDEDLPALYSMAKVLVFPSLFEGFGLPLLEAMTFGCPVIASNATSIVEVVGDAAVLINPLDHNEIAEKISLLLSDPKMHDSYRQKGFERVKEFSWHRSAEKVLAIYENTLNQRN